MNSLSAAERRGRDRGHGRERTEAAEKKEVIMETMKESKKEAPGLGGEGLL